MDNVGEPLPQDVGTPLTWVSAVKEAIKNFEIEDIEGALVRRFIEDQNLSLENNSLLKRLASPRAKTLEVEKYFNLKAVLTLDEIVKAFELLVPPAEAKMHGAVFTPSLITSFMSAKTIDAARANSGALVLDPACGCGALLVAALRRIHALTSQTPSLIVKRLVGVDVSESSLERARILLALTCLNLGEDPVTLDYQLKKADSLTLDWAKEFPFSQGKFEVILSNPPYVRYQHLEISLRESLSKRWSTLNGGSPNLYFAFFEMSQELLSPTGVSAFITPNNFFATKSATKLREFLSIKSGLNEIVDFADAKVFDALIYTTLTFFSKAHSLSIKYANAPSAEALEGLQSKDYSQVKRIDLSSQAWELAGPLDATNISKISSTGQKLGDITDIRYGIKTCRDRAYLVKGDVDSDGFLTKTYLGQDWKIELGATIPHLVVPDIKDEKDIALNSQRIIYPYQVVAGKAEIIKEEDFKTLYPECYAYLQAVRPELDNRDKGKKNYAAWYAYARTQAINPLDDKLLTPEYAARPRFMRDQRTALFSNGCSISIKEDADGKPVEELSVIQAILSSGVFHYYIDKTSTSIDGGFRSYQKTRIAPFGIISLSLTQKDTLLKLSAKEADDFLAKAYGIILPKQYKRK